MQPEILIGVIMVAAFLAGGFFMSRRVRRGWSPRQQQRLHRGLFYYALAVLFFACIMQFFSGGMPWTFFACWALFVVTIAYAAFRRPTTTDLLKNYVQDSRHSGQCGYDLTGNVSGVCPECGWAIPASPPQVETLAWVQWWSGWQIDYLENWKRSLLSMIVLAVLFAGLTVWFLHGMPLTVMTIIPGLMAVHFAINAVRVFGYGRRQRQTPPQ